jgi:hypothetical protein
MSERDEKRRERLSFLAVNVGIIGWEFLYYLQGSPLRQVLGACLVLLPFVNLAVWLAIRWKRARRAKSQSDSGA